MQMDGDINGRAQRRDQHLSGIRLKQSCHVLQRQHMRTLVFKTPCHIQVILQIVTVARIGV